MLLPAYLVAALFPGGAAAWYHWDRGVETALGLGAAAALLSLFALRLAISLWQSR